MDVSPTERQSQIETDTYPLLMEQVNNLSCNEHIVDIPGRTEASSSISNEGTTSGLEASSREDRPSTSVRVPSSRPSVAFSNGQNNSNLSSTRRGDAQRRRSPLNSGLWISVELVLTVSQIVASVIVLAVSRDEHPRAPLFAWIVGYASGCVATLPLLYWRFCHRNQISEHESAQPRQGSTHISVPAGSYSVSVSRNSEVEDRRSSPGSNQNSAIINARLKTLVEYFKMALDCFFAVWFVVGNVWIFGGHSSAADAPYMYRLCIVFLTFSCIGYAMPFILCATICCCLPCIISLLGFREDLGHTRGATSESINALPTYKFKLNKNRNGDDNNSVAGGGGTVAAGTEQERSISGEDAVCCICLAKYANNDELRELPCSHFFHKECVDKWLKINACCPLCKNEVGESILGSLSGSNSGEERIEGGRVGSAAF